ncbi:MAG: hypothetical protein IPK79_06855 [Vampirovibrionales bacterium]|nr:hypothetical protein [Vampirovibrionales bacterium]
MTDRVSRPQALFFTLMDNLALFEEVIDAALSSGKTWIGLWGVHFLTRYDAFIQKWLRWPLYDPATQARPKPMADVLRRMLTILERPIAELSAYATPPLRPAPRCPVAPAGRSSNTPEGLLSSSFSFSPEPKITAPRFPRRFLLAFARRRLAELEGTSAEAPVQKTSSALERTQTLSPTGESNRDDRFVIRPAWRAADLPPDYQWSSYTPWGEGLMLARRCRFGRRLKERPAQFSDARLDAILARQWRAMPPWVTYEGKPPPRFRCDLPGYDAPQVPSSRRQARGSP